MWLFVVAAGSGYLARCLQSASGTKKQRLIKQVIEKQDDDPHASRSPPQEVVDNYPVSMEAMRLKERFDKLAEQHQAVLDKKSDDGSSGWSFSSSDTGCFPMLSYQKGYCDVQPTASRRFKGKVWPSWPKNVKGTQLSRKRTPRAGSPAKPPSSEQKTEDNDVPEVRCAESEDFFSGAQQATSQCRGAGFSEDGFWHRKALAGKLEGDSLGIFDWATSKKLHGNSVDWTVKGIPISTCSRRHSIRSTTSSTPDTPSDGFGPALPPVEVFLRKRKADINSLFKSRSPRRHPAILRKEVVFFALGLRAGVFVMLFYMSTIRNPKQAAEMRTDIDSIPEGGSIDSGAGSAQRAEVDDDNESVTSVVTVEHQEPDQMAALEAELEAELEIMEFNLQANKLPGVKPHSDSPESPTSFDKDERDAKENWAVSPRELDRKLRIVLEERQADRIRQLEAEVEEKDKLLLAKEEEVRSWRLRLDRLKAIYLASADDAGHGGEVGGCHERPGSRKRWFSNVTQSTSIHASSPLPQSSIEEIDDETSNVPFKHTGRGSDLFDESAEDHSDDASRTVRDFFQNLERNSAFSSPDSKMSTSSSTVRAQRMETSTKLPDHRDDGYEKATRELREVKMNSSTRIKEANYRFQDAERRNSTGSTAPTRSHYQRQRRRWFS